MSGIIKKWQLPLAVLFCSSCSDISASEVSMQDVCGKKSSKISIALTKERVIKAYNPSFPSSPYLEDVSKGCVGIGFSISPDGLAINAKIRKTSHNRIFDKAAKKAIQNYRFQKDMVIFQDAYLIIKFDIDK